MAVGTVHVSFSFASSGTSTVWQASCKYLGGKKYALEKFCIYLHWSNKRILDVGIRFGNLNLLVARSQQCEGERDVFIFIMKVYLDNHNMTPKGN